MGVGGWEGARASQFLRGTRVRGLIRRGRFPAEYLFGRVGNLKVSGPVMEVVMIIHGIYLAAMLIYALWAT